LSRAADGAGAALATARFGALVAPPVFFARTRAAGFFTAFFAFELFVFALELFVFAIR